MSKQVKSLWRIESSYNIVSTRKSRPGIAQAGNIQYRQPSTEAGKRAKYEGETYRHIRCNHQAEEPHERY